MEQGINYFIKTKKKKKKIKKMIMFIIFFLLLLFLFFAKAPIFNIKVVQYKNNKIIDQEELYKLYNPIGHNLIFINVKKAKNDIMKNPYVESVDFDKHYPNELTIKITEKNACYYVKDKSEYYILADDLSILEVKNNISGLKLIELDKINIENRNVGQKITSKKYIIENATKIGELLSRNISNINFSKLNLSNKNNILLYYGDVKIVIGLENDLQEKLNRAINVLSDSKENLKKGYIYVYNINKVTIMNEDHPAEQSEEDLKQKEIYDNMIKGDGISEEYGD